jgi:hypothetical protein
MTCRRWICPTTRAVRVRFSNRPFWVKRFQTIRRCSVDVSHGLVLLFGIGTKALPLWDSRTRWNNLMGGLAVKATVGPSGHANSPHPSSREGHHSTAGWISSFLLSLFASGDSITSAELAACCTRALRLDPTVRDTIPHFMVMIDKVRERAEEFDVLHFHVDLFHFPLFRALQLGP